MFRFFNSHLPVLVVALLAFWTLAQTVSFAFSVGNATLAYSTVETVPNSAEPIEASTRNAPSGTAEQQGQRSCFLTCFSDADFCSSHCSATLAMAPAERARDWRIQRAGRAKPDVLDGVEVPVDPAPPKTFI
ncbi:hypothetical protein [uncultured Roseibium sp.]|uniref:hypothetical protein n=1 Tax=uncultured Roseibium sp. TaxID=1936171 RepID=UPI00260E7B01|nr:hypothetical protein [uncultured Roseibium sp.]